MLGNLSIARSIHAVPARRDCIFGALFLVCVGSLGLTCPAPTYGGEPPGNPANTAEQPAKTAEPSDTPKLEPPVAPSSPLPGRAPPESGQSVTALNEEELEVARQMVRDFPKDVVPLAFLGNIYSAHGLNKEAVRYWEQSLLIDPNRAETYDAMATVALARQEYERGLELARKAVSLNPKLTSSRRRVGESLLGLGRPKEALEDLQEALKAAPNDAEIHYLLGRTFVQLEDLDAAKKSYEEAMKINPRHAAACHQLSIVYARLNLLDQAKACRERHVRLRSETTDSEQKWVNEYDDLRLVRQQVAQTCDTAARYYRAHQNQARSKQLWLRAAALDPHHVASRLQLALLYGQAGQTAVAVDFCKQAEEIAPRDPMVHLNVGILAANLRRLDVAEGALRKSNALAPDNAVAARLLSQVLQESNGNAAEAAALARKAVEREPSAESYYVLAAAEAYRGDNKAAVAAMQRAVELAPADSRYRKGLEQLQSVK